MTEERSPLAAQLWELLPAFCRERDESGDLRRLIDVQGDFLQSFHDLLRQLYRDRFPLPDATPEDACQPWVLPYIAALLDVQLVSSDEAGRRAEVGRAVAWRQGKGSLRVLADIARRLLGKPVVVGEGWRRVATVARVDAPRLPAAWYGENRDYRASASPVFQSRHPGLAAAFVDVGLRQRTVRLAGAGEDEAGSQTRPREVPFHPHGVPCFPGSSQDLAPRTVDLRAPSGNAGQAHPRRVLIFTPPWDGHFPPDAPGVGWRQVLAGRADPARIEVREETVTDGGGPRLRRYYRGLTDAPLRIRGVVEIHDAVELVFEHLRFDNRVEIGAARVRFEGCAARRVLVETSDRKQPVLVARNSLFDRVETPRGLLRLEYCTVLRELVAEALQCSDSLLLPRPRKDRGDTDLPREGCIRYSRVVAVPAAERVADGAPSALRFGPGNTAVEPLFLSTRYGEPGCGVLHPGAADALREGAEDGGEMGAYHGLRHVLRETATLRKLRDFLPLGQRVALIDDPALRCPAARLKRD